MRYVSLCLLVFLQGLCAPLSFAQIITTYAGPTLPVNGQPALTAAIDGPEATASDNAGGFFVVSSTQSRVYHVAADGTLRVVAGTGAPGYSGDGGPAISAQLFFPTSIAVDSSGNLFIADTDNHRVRKVSPGGVITTVAGSGAGPGEITPVGLAIDSAGNLLIADAANARIGKVGSNGIVTTVAGNGTAGFSGDGSLAVFAELNSPSGIAMDSSGNMFIADTYNERIRKVTPNGIITTVAGTGVLGSTGDGGPATSAELFNPHAVAVDTSGNLFVCGGMRQRRTASFRLSRALTFPRSVRLGEPLSRLRSLRKA
jgi:sugar lactone lactonase YvrE